MSFIKSGSEPSRNPDESEGRTSSDETRTQPSTPQIIVQDEPDQISSPISSPSSTSTATNNRNESSCNENGERSFSQEGERPHSQRRQYSNASGVSSIALSSTPTSPLLTNRSFSGGSIRSPMGESNEGQNKNKQSQSAKAGGLNSHRTSSFEYKETLDATTRHLEDGSRIINQYKLGKMIGKGAYGSVYSATLLDDPNTYFAVKEFGKTRLRKTFRAQNFRKPNRGRGRGGTPMRGGKPIKEIENSESGGGHLGGDDGAKSPTRGLNALKLEPESNNSQGGNPEDPLSLIRREIAILKKLHHPHLVHLYEVLDDPTKDELYMVFEYCPDGAVIDIRLHERVEPLKEEVARKYFIQIMLGVEYLHHHDIVHRDLKPDNILLQNNRKVCKIVDFGVSEFFIKPGDDTMQKSAGSPAFMSPELCKAGHGDFHGKDSDMWSLGVTFYCMVVGHLPFDKSQFLELYESIQGDTPRYPSHLSPNCKDLLQRMLNKNPADRITIDQMRQHPFITDDGKETVISMEENIRDLVEEVTAEELDSAINRIASVFTLARAISKFKRAGSRASSAGSLADVTSSILSKGKEVGQQGTAAVKEWGKTYRAKDEENTGGDDEHKNDYSSRSGSQSDEPLLEHLAEAHVVMGTSNRQWAAEHIARAVMRATGHGIERSDEGKEENKSSRREEVRPKDSNDEDKDSKDEKTNDEDKVSKDEMSDGNPSKGPQRREEILHFSPNKLDEEPQTDYFGEGAQEKNTSNPLSGMREYRNHSPSSSDHTKPKLLPDQPVVTSPAFTSLPTPDQAAAAYKGKRAD